MAFVIRCLPLILLVSSSLAQYDDYHHGSHSYESNYIKGEPVHHHGLEEHHQHHGEEYDLDYHAHPKYSFDYSVKDPHTGDNKEHWETRDGDKVKGTYTILETDGTKRVVEYEADDKNGFNAVVHKIGTPKEEEKVFEPHFQHKEEVKHVYEPHHHYKEEIKPAYEPHHYHHDYHASFGGDDGFVPIIPSFDH